MEAPVTEHSLTVFFPMHNEEENAERSVQRALEVLPKLVRDFEVICVNDGSQDRTGEICDALAIGIDQVRVVHHEVNKGYGAAVKSGFAAAQHDLVFFTDGDLQFDLAELELFLERLDEADVIVGYRKKRQDPPHRLLNGWLWNKLMWLVLGLKFRDVDCAFKLIRREYLDKIGPLETDGAMLSAELLVKLKRSGARMLEMGVSHYPRPSGESSGANPSVIFKAFLELGANLQKLRRL